MKHIEKIETIISEATEYGAVFPDTRPTRNSSDCLDDPRDISEDVYRMQHTTPEWKEDAFKTLLL